MLDFEAYRLTVMLQREAFAFCVQLVTLVATSNSTTADLCIFKMLMMTLICNAPMTKTHYSKSSAHETVVSYMCK